MMLGRRAGSCIRIEIAQALLYDLHSASGAGESSSTGTEQSIHEHTRQETMKTVLQSKVVLAKNEKSSNKQCLIRR